MSDHSHIEWTDATWNPVAGCSLVSPGCTNCYAMRRTAPRLAANPATPHYHGTVEKSKAGYVWTGKIGIASDAVLLKPLSWKRPRRIFVNSTSDLFHPDVPDAVIDRIFAVMALCPQHTFQVLTKRPERMRKYFAARTSGDPWAEAADYLADAMGMEEHPHVLEPRDLPLPNVWLGTSVEDQQRADERIPHLLATPAAVRFISAEPLLGPIDLTNLRPPEAARLYGFEKLDALWGSWMIDGFLGSRDHECGPLAIDQVITGGESGLGARLTHPDWVRGLRDQCAVANVAFFHKQWGEWLPVDQDSGQISYGKHKHRVWAEDAGSELSFYRVGKRAAGRLLDGIEHNGMPGVAP